MNNDERIAYYLSKKIVHTPSLLNKLSPVKRVFISDKYDRVQYVSKDTNIEKLDKMSQAYTQEIIRIIKKHKIDSIIPVLCQDNRKPPSTPMILKSRTISMPNSTLLKLYKQRHWLHIKEIYLCDKEFSSKNNTCIWRGSTTGEWGPNFRAEATSARYHLFDCWAESTSDLLDLGIANECQYVNKKITEKEYLLLKEKFTKQQITKSEMMKCKYIVSLEGNDVSTSLNWILASKSVPIMPIPSAETWLMEGSLEPWRHYAPIKKDTSDLLEVIELLNCNPALANSIALEGRNYTEKFLDDENEELIELKVLEEFTRKML